MQIEERATGDVTILDLKGKMTLGEGDIILKDKVNSLALQGKKQIVLNLADVPYIDSAGLGEFHASGCPGHRVYSADSLTASPIVDCPGDC